MPRKDEDDDIVAQLRREIETAKQGLADSSRPVGRAHIGTGKVFDPTSYKESIIDKRREAHKQAAKEQAAREMEQCTFRPSITRASEEIILSQSFKARAPSYDSSPRHYTDSAIRDRSKPIHERLLVAGDEIKKKRELELQQKLEKETSPRKLVSKRSEEIVRSKPQSDTLTRLLEDDVAKRRERQRMYEEQKEQELRRATEIKSHLTDGSIEIVKRLERAGSNAKDRILAATESFVFSKVVTQDERAKMKNLAPSPSRSFTTSLNITPGKATVRPKTSPASESKQSRRRSVGLETTIKDPEAARSPDDAAKTPRNSSRPPRHEATAITPRPASATTPRPTSATKTPRGSPAAHTAGAGKTPSSKSKSPPISAKNTQQPDGLHKEAARGSEEAPKRGGDGGGSRATELLTKAEEENRTLREMISIMEEEAAEARVKAEQHEGVVAELEEARFQLEEAQLKADEIQLELEETKLALLAASEKADLRGATAERVDQLESENRELREQNRKVTDELAYVKTNYDKVKKDLDTMTDKSQQVVRLNAQLMAQVKQLKNRDGNRGQQ